MDFNDGSIGGLTRRRRRRLRSAARRRAFPHSHSKKFAGLFRLRPGPRQREGQQLVQRGQRRRNLEDLRGRPVRANREERLATACVRGRHEAVRFLHLDGKRRRRPARSRLEPSRASRRSRQSARAPSRRRSSISALVIFGRRSCQSTWSHAWMPTACPAAAASRIRATVSLPPADVGRGEERPVEHRAKAVGRRRARREDLPDEALPEDPLDRLAARVGSEREEERRLDAVLFEEVDEPRHALERPAVRVDVDLEGEFLQTTGGLRPLR